MIFLFRFIRYTTWLLGAVSLVVAFPETVSAQNLGTVMDRLERLERDIRTLNIQISRGPNVAGKKNIRADSSGPKSRSVGVLLISQRQDNLEQDIRSATGSMEELGHHIFRLTERLDKLVGDVDFRLRVIESKIRSDSSAVSPELTAAAEASPVPVRLPPGSIGASPEQKTSVAAVTPSPSTFAQGPKTLGTVSARAVQALRQNPSKPPPSVPQVSAASLLPAGTPKEQYTYALNLLRQTNYDQAELVLAEFIATQGQHSLAGNAQYWLGETYYVRADYEQAAQTFFTGYKTSPSNVKAPDMLLKLGMSLAQLKKGTEACATFDKLSKDFPRASARINSAVARERKRTGC